MYEKFYGYMNPMVALRKEQIEVLTWNNNPETLKKIFNSIPRNFRKIFMFEVDFGKANQKCGAEFLKRLKSCLKYCLEVIG